MLKIIRSGLLSTLQDSGRTGLRHLGIPWSGTVCPAWQLIANALAGNEHNAPIIECFEGGLQLEASSASIRLALVGSPSSDVKLESQGIVKSLKMNRSVTLASGDTLTINSTGKARLAVVAVAGIQITDHLGSTSTYAKALLGGLCGKPLATGDKIPVDDAVLTTFGVKPDYRCTLPDGLTYTTSQLRVMAGPQFDAFSAAGINTFLSDAFELGMEADRMGARLTGPAIEHLDESRRDIVSDAILPGSVQVPGNGQPIVMLNDAHTAGGYPKIATVISCDLPLLAVQRAGAKFSFSLIDIDTAINARLQQRDLVAKTIDSFSPCARGELDSLTLLQNNLIDGVTDGS